MKMAIVINSNSGADSPEDQIHPLVSKILEIFSGLKNFFLEEKPRIFFITSPSPHYFRELHRRIMEDKFDLLIVGGGDGTISTLAGLIAHSPIKLGILPLGTFNHFARDLKIPLDPVEAIKLMAKSLEVGEYRYIDVGEVNGKTFINNSSLGLYPQIVKERDLGKASRPRGFKKLMAMSWASFKVLCRYRLLNITIHLPEGIICRKTPFVFIGNNAYELTFFTNEKRPKLDDGKLFIYTVKSHNVFNFLKLLFYWSIGRLEKAEEFEVWPATLALLQTKRPTIDVATDGEVLKMETPLFYKVKPQALCVLVPPNSTIEPQKTFDAHQRPHQVPHQPKEARSHETHLPPL